MKLDDLFKFVEPIFAEQAHADDVGLALYGTRPVRQGRRLAIHQHMARLRRAAKLRAVFPRVHAYVSGTRHEQAWTELATAYFADEPWRETKALPNTAGFAAFLARSRLGRELPAWIPAVADLEWWLAAIRSAPDDPSDARLGPVRPASTLELRPYSYDLVQWMREVDKRQDREPRPDPIVAVFWRDARQVACLRAVSPREVRVLEAIRQRVHLSADWAARLGVTLEEVGTMVRYCHQVGAMLGDLRTLFAPPEEEG